jgi:hypothetical protein
MDNEQYTEFIQKQALVYEKFEDSRKKVLAEGLNKHQLSSKGVYMIYFVHPSDISERIEELSKGISRIVPSIIYSASNVHTTVSDYDGPRLNFEPNEEVLKKLSLGVKHTPIRLFFPAMLYDGLISNQDTVILRGNIGKAFLETVYAVMDGIKNEGIELRMPWGAHITCARINNRIGDRNQILKLLNYIDSYDLRFYSIPTHIGVGHGMFSDDGSSFKLNKFDEYKFR